MLTFLPLEEIEKMESYEGSQLNAAKEILAFELTKLVHGEEEAAKAQSAARGLFGGGDAANMPTAEITQEDFTDGSVDIISLLVKSGLVPTRSEGRRAVEQGGVTVNGEKEMDLKKTYTVEAFGEDGLVLKKGKKNFKKIVVK
jgi:tyrosyl-tRNA synthetase